MPASSSAAISRSPSVVVDIGDALVKAAAHRDRIGDDAIVEAVAARIDDDRAVGTDPGMQRSEGDERRIRRNVARILRVRIDAARTEDVTMAVACPRAAS